nr:Ig-like V-type domain-containing protein FAM187A [Parasteatoda tepidariorum]
MILLIWQKQNMMLPSKPVDTQILNEYKKGIPCRSHLLPEPIRNLPAVIDKKSEFVVGFCKIPCASFGGIISVTDQTGAVIDTVDNSKGVYSLHQPLPPLPALVSRRTLHEEVGKSIMMTCPGNNQGRFLIWRNDSFVINPSKVHVLTKGRVKIDFANNLHIRKLRFSDTSIYSCWNDKTLVGTIRLQVIEKTSETRFSAYVLNLGIFFTFIIISTVTFTVCRNVRLDKE